MPRSTPEGHDVRFDYAGARGWPRLTCRSEDCGGEVTCLRQPYMLVGQWEGAVDDFLQDHPPAKGRLINDDRRTQSVTIEKWRISNIW